MWQQVGKSSQKLTTGYGHSIIPQTSKKVLNNFRKNIWFQALAIIAVVLLMWVPAWIHVPSPKVDAGGPLYLLIVANMAPRLASILALAMVIGEGVLFNIILYNKKMIGQGELSPMLLYIVAMSVGLESLTLTPMLFVNIFLILGIGLQMSRAMVKSIDGNDVFGAATCVAMATICYPSAILFLLPLMANMINYRLYRGNEWLMLLLGFLAPFITLEMILFVADRMFYQNYMMLYSLTDYHLTINGDVSDWVSGLLFVVVLLAGLLATMVQLSRNTGNHKKNVKVVLFLLMAAVPLLAYQQIVPIASQCLALPFALAGTFLLNGAKKGIASLLIVVALIGIIIFNCV